MKFINILFILLFICTLLLGQQTIYPFQNPNLDPETRVEDLVNRLTLEEKVSQMLDISPAIERLGIPQYNWWNECLHGVARAGAATSFPQAIGMAATWNVELIHQVADVISTEARAKFNHSVRKGQWNRYQGLTMWAPNINIFRDPRWGQGQETYGEDPFLTSQLAVAFVNGLQGNDPEYFKVIATPKHYAVHSGPEYNRHSFDAYTDKRDLWETYLPAFRAAVVEGGAYSVMSAYNRYLGESASASPFLLQDILRGRWGFPGYVVSDCGAISDIYRYHKIVETPQEAAALAVKAGVDLNCGSTYAHLTEAVRQGLISEGEIDRALSRLIRARIKLGLLNPEGEVPWIEISDEYIEAKPHKALALKTACESLVLLKNERKTLPLSKNIKSITVMGPQANDRHFVLGNYFGTPTQVTTILEGIQQKVAKKTKVHYFKGTNLTDSDAIFDVVTDNNFAGDIKAEFYNNTGFEGEPVHVKMVERIDFEWGGAAPVDLLTPGNYSVRYTGVLQPGFSGEVALDVSGSGGAWSLWLDNREVLSTFNGQQIPDEVKVPVKRNKKVNFRVEYRCTNPWMASIQLLWNKEELMGKEQMWQIVNNSDVIIFVGGITARLEGEEMPVEVEGFYKGDRTNLQLPCVQRELLKKLHETGKPVVFVLTSGSAMAINWEQENLPAILQAWYPGQAAGEAVADVLFGDFNPSGRLPVTFYHSVTDLPPFEDYHMKGRTYRYFEGEALYPFGYGLSYSGFTFSNPRLASPVMEKNATNKVSVMVTNTGPFDGQTVVQLYVSDKESSVPSPIKSLRGFQKIFLQNGESQVVSFDITPANLSITDKDGDAFVEPGEFEIYVGESSDTSNKQTLRVL